MLYFVSWRISLLKPDRQGRCKTCGNGWNRCEPGKVRLTWTHAYGAADSRRLP